MNEKPGVSVRHCTDGYSVQCIYASCAWRGDPENPESSAFAHVEACPGHTVIVEPFSWTEYTSDGASA